MFVSRWRKEESQVSTATYHHAGLCSDSIGTCVGAVRGMKLIGSSATSEIGVVGDGTSVLDLLSRAKYIICRLITCFS